MPQPRRLGIPYLPGKLFAYLMLTPALAVARSRGIALTRRTGATSPKNHVALLGIKATFSRLRLIE